MSRNRKALFACIAAAGLLAVLPFSSESAPKPSGPSGSGYRPANPGGSRPSHPGGFRPGHSGNHGRHYGHRGYYGGHYGGYYPGWGWGLGIGLGVPLALGWYDPWWRYPAYGYGPVYRSYSDSCEFDEDCMRARFSRSEPEVASTELPPPAAGAEGGPTERPLHLNYCDSAKAWFPQVRSCPGGWRLVRPEYR